jgi:hypothetical protein
MRVDAAVKRTELVALAMFVVLYLTPVAVLLAPVGKLTPSAGFFSASNPDYAR